MIEITYTCPACGNPVCIRYEPGGPPVVAWCPSCGSKLGRVDGEE